MRDWFELDPYADIEADAERARRRRQAQKRKEQQAAAKLKVWMAAINARIAELQAAGATHIHLEEGEEGELPSLTYTFAPRPKQAAQTIFDDARPRLSSGLA